MSEAHPSVDKIFSVALELPSVEARVKYLDEVCGDNPDLRREIERLLNAHPEVGEFMESPAVDISPTVDRTDISERPGTTIGRYKLLQQIGEGGFGVVFMADQQEPIVRRVALKVIKPGMDTKEVVARFEAERQALALMDHPGIARVLDAGTTDSGRPYFVMELVRGIPITEFCEKSNLAISERLQLFVSVCQAIQHAHQKGVIHRDIKPSNVLVTLRDGQPETKVIDFGIAKALNQRLTDRTLFTKFAEVVGTPLYMSPEQAELSSLDIDTRSDIYSLGVLLYELLTGSTPFSKTHMRKAALGELRRIIREDDPPKPSTKISSLGQAAATVAQHRKTDPKKLSNYLSGELDWVTMKALEKDRADRYETANDFARDVQRYLSDEPVEACPPSAVYRFRKFVRRHKAQLATVATIGVVLVLATVVSLYLAVWALHAESVAKDRLDGARRNEEIANKERIAAEKAREFANQQQQIARRQRDVAEQNLYVASMRLGLTDLPVAQIERLQLLLNRYFPHKDLPDFRGWEWYYLLSHCRTDLHTLRAHEGGVLAVAWSPDGKRLASAGKDGTLRIWDSITAKEQNTLHGHEKWVRSLSWSPDNRRLVSGGTDKTIRVWDTSNGAELLCLSGHTKAVLAVAWSPDSHQLASGSQDGTVRIWDALSGLELAVLKGHGNEVTSVAWSPDSQYLISGSADSTIKVWDASKESEIRSMRINSRKINSLDWSPGGQYVATTGLRDWSVRIWHPLSGKLALTLKGDQASISKRLAWRNCVAWSPNGQRLTIGGDDDVIRIWNKDPRGERFELKGHAGVVWQTAWSPDGKRLASASEDGTVRIWEPGALRRNLLSSTGIANSIGNLKWSPDGRRIASVYDHTVCIWDSTMQKEILNLNGHSDTVYGVSWSPDGKYLASCAADATVKIWDLATSRELKTCRGHTSVVWSVAWSPKGGQLASGSQDGTVKLWDTETGDEIRTFRGHSEVVRCVAWSPDGRRLAASHGTSLAVKIWEITTGNEITIVRQHRLGIFNSALAWSPDGRLLALSGSRGLIHVFDWAAEKEVALLRSHKDCLALAWHPTEPRLASGGWDGTIKVWSLDSQSEVLSMPGRGPVAWSPDGQKLAARVLAGCIRIWDASRGYEVAHQQKEYRRSMVYRLLDAGQFDDAISLARNLTAEFPDKLDDRNLLAIAYFRRGCDFQIRGEHRKAIADFDSAIRHDPGYRAAIEQRDSIQERVGKKP